MLNNKSHLSQYLDMAKFKKNLLADFCHDIGKIFGTDSLNFIQFCYDFVRHNNRMVPHVCYKKICGNLLTFQD